jgi:hypothetical protein
MYSKVLIIVQFTVAVLLRASSGSSNGPVCTVGWYYKEEYATVNSVLNKIKIRNKECGICKVRVGKFNS